MLALAAVFVAAPATAQTGEVGDFCAGDFVNPANCTANDVLIEEFEIVQVIESCTTGTLNEAEVIFDAVIVSNSPDRFGIGLFIALDGDSAITGDQCLHDYLSPFSSDPGDWEQVPVNGGGDQAYIEPFPNLNGDQCGDIPGTSRVKKELQQVRIQCNDTSGDGFVDISACASWENNGNQQCGSLDDAVPGTPSKCGCTEVPTGLALPANLTIRKITTDGNGTFGFETTSDPEFDQDFSLPASFDITTSGGEGTENFGGVVEPGTYTIDEVVPADWRLDSVSCDNGDDPTVSGGGVTLGSGEDVTCTFTNSPIVPGSVTIVKSAIGGDGTFGYSGDLGNFSIGTSGGSGNETFNDVTPGTYDVTESAPAGWDLTDISCSNDSSTDLDTATASVEVGEDESVTCTFTNRKRGSIAISKVTQPTGGTGFDFQEDITGAPGEFSLDHGQTEDFTNLVPASYSVSELVPAGWDLTDLNCTGAGAGNTTIDLEGASVDINLEPGRDVECTFTNTQRASLTIEKDTVGGDGAFEFASLTLPDETFSIDTTVSDSTTYGNLEPGTYDVAELGPPDGWVLLNATCSSSEDLWDFDADNNQLFGIQLNPGADVTCTFNNGLLGSVSVTKNTIGGTDVFDFVGDAPIGNFSLDTAGDNTETMEFTNILEPGTYTVEETPIPDGWELTNVECALDTSRSSSTSLGDATATFTVDYGETVNCTFTNTRDGQIIIEKQTVPDGSDQDFEFTGDVAGTISDGGQLTLDAQPGTYTSTEAVPPGWALTDISCSGETDSIVNIGDEDVEINLAAGETITCVFTNTELGSFSVVKSTDPEGVATEFTFTGDLAGAIADGESLTISDLLPDTYTTEEDVPDGWTLTGIECVGDENSEVTIVGESASVDLAAGEDVVCTFSNFLNRGTIIVEKEADPESTDQTFDFTANFTEDFILGSGESETTTDLLPSAFSQTYSVSEDVPDGWSLDSATCDNGDDPGAIDLQPGQTVTCTFENAINRGTIVVAKVADPDTTEQTFDFTSDFAGGFSLGAGEDLSTGNLLPSSEVGNYSVSESVPDGWSLDSAVCDGGNTPDAIDLQPDETVTCTFTNSINRGSITVTKVADPSDTGQEFQFTSDFAGNFGLAHGESESAGDLLPTSEAGTYSVAETVPDNWTLTSATCDDGSDPAEIDLAPGEDVTCTFTNTQDRGEIVVVKEADPADTEQLFTFSPSWGSDFTLGAGESQASGLLVAGGYSVSESVPDGWSLDSATCDNGDDPSDITLDAGEVVTCTFENSINRGSITVVKDADPDNTGQSFEFTSDFAGNFSLAHGESETAGDLLPSSEAGTYSVSESEPENWTLTSATCDDGSDPAEIDLAPGEDVTCTFVNTQDRGEIIVVKEADPDTTDQLFTFSPSWGDDFTLGAGESEASGMLVAGGYSVSETVPDDWSLDSATCDNGDDPADITLGAGDEVTCTFVNSRDRGTIVVEKVADPADTDQIFEFTFNGTPFSLGAGESETFSDLLPSDKEGPYTVEEIVPDDWSLDSATCDNGDDPASIELESSETVTCTFTNIEQTLEIIEIVEVCENDTPYVDYDIDMVGFGGDDELTIRWIIIEDGSNDVAEELTGQDPSGRLLWPGATVDNNGDPTGWPGWVFVPGQGWVEVPTNLRPSMQLEFEVNPTVSQVVNYPPSTPECEPGPAGVPEPFRVPTLSRLGLITMALVLMGLAGLVIRRRQRVASE